VSLAVENLDFVIIILWQFLFYFLSNGSGILFRYDAGFSGPRRRVWRVRNPGFSENQSFLLLLFATEGFSPIFMLRRGRAANF
jgi:hypothetical protein